MTPEQEAEILKFFSALGLIAGTAGAVYRDKKVDMNDLGHAMALIGKVDDIIDGFDDMDLVWDGMKQMSVDEIVDTLKDAVNVGKIYESSRKDS